jgi:TonB-linked SusC/RagA family outer membrane protein
MKKKLDLWVQSHPELKKLIMQLKIVFLIIVTSVSSVLASPGYSQSTKVSLQLKNSKLEKVMDEIERQSGFYFIFNQKQIDVNRNMDIQVDDALIVDILPLLFNGTNVNYSVFDKNILLSVDPINNNLRITQSSTLPQQIVITGKVTNNKGESLPGVSVVLKGTIIGVITDIDGKYNIEVPDENGILVFSFIGHSLQEIAISGRTKIDVVLMEESIEVSGITVTALGIKRETKSLTYGTENVGVKQITEARDLNVINSLQGKVPGIAITTSGSGVGAASRVTLRGNRSISGDSQPLYIIDGVPVLGNPQDFNPDDFASITVLKGSNAAAIYGSDAQNGAIIFTSKKGQEGKIKISFNNTFMAQKAKVDDIFQNVYGQGANGIYQKGSGQSWGPKMEGQIVEQWTLDPSRAGETYPMGTQPNNVNDLFRTGFNLSNNFQVSYGSKKTQTFFSATATEANGILPNNSLQRTSAMVRIVNELSDKFSLDAKINYMIQKTDNPTPQSDNNFNPFQQIYTMPRNIRTQDAKIFEFKDPNGLIKQDYWSPTASTAENPYWVMNRNISNQNRGRLTGLASLTYKLTDALHFMLRGEYDRIDDSEESKDYNGTFVRAEKGRYTKTKSNNYLYNADFLLSFNKKLAVNWNLDIRAGGNYKKVDNESLSSNTGLAMLVPNFFTLSNTNNPVTSFDPGSPIVIQSLYAFGTLAWKNALFMDFTGRNDWSSTLPANSRSYFYPSVGLSAVLSDLIPSFPKLFSFAQIKASYAKVGSSPRPFMLSRTATFLSGGTNGFLSIGDILPNLYLRPEETKSFETGMDLRFLKGRLGLNVTYFKTNTMDQLFTVALPVGSGASSYFTNGGNIQNKGEEIKLTSTPIQSGNFKWDFDIYFSRIKNTVVTISDERPKVVVWSNYTSDYVIQQGLDYGDMFGRGFQRDDQGRVIVGSNGVPLLTSSRSFNVGTFTPDFKAGISSSFSYKNFSFSFVIDHTQGGTIVSYTKINLEYDGNAKETLQGRDGGLIFGDNIFSNYSAVLENGTPNNIPVNAEILWRAIANPSVPNIEVAAVDATNTRIREAVISYNLPESFLQKLKLSSLSNLSVSLVGRNLGFIYRKYPYLDPEMLIGTGAGLEGYSSFSPPTSRYFGMNLKVAF